MESIIKDKEDSGEIAEVENSVSNINTHNVVDDHTTSPSAILEDATLYDETMRKVDKWTKDLSGLKKQLDGARVSVSNQSEHFLQHGVAIITRSIERAD